MRNRKDFFGRYWTKYIPLGYTHYGYNQQVVFMKGNTKTGMIKFKSVSMNPQVSCIQSTGEIAFDTKIINPSEQWLLITKMLNND